MDDLQKMQQLIEEMRQRLHDTVKSRCFTDPEVVKISQELNKLLNEYEQILKKSCKGE
jgi:hypothetical protein